MRPDGRRSGVGRELVRRVARHALHAGCSHVEWQTRATNRAALRFYEEVCGAKERIEAGGIRWVNMIMHAEDMRRLTSDGE